MTILLWFALKFQEEKLMSSKIIAGRYELLEKIGDGGMAVVYKAKCRLLNRYVAVKILNRNLSMMRNSLKIFVKNLMLPQACPIPTL